MAGASKGRDVAAGLLRYSQRGPLHAMRLRSTQGTPFLWVQCAGTVGVHRCCGCGVAPPSGPSPLRCAATSASTRSMGVCRARCPRSSILISCAWPLRHTAFAVAAEVGRIGRLCSERTACRGTHVGGIEWDGVAAGLLRYFQRAPRARDVTKEYSRGSPPMGTMRGYRRGTSLLWVQHSTTERPSPLRVCSKLNNNKLTGSLPSSLSALTNLGALCVPPSTHGVCACSRRGSDRSALLRARGMSGDACRGHRRGAVRQQGCCGTFRGDLGPAMLLRSTQGAALLWVQCEDTVGAHRCCGCGVVPPSGRVRFGCAATSAITR
jgi:hypothetical protein